MEISMDSQPLNTIIVIGNYLPRRCGIATYTTDICEALANTLGERTRVEAVAMDDVPEGYPYPDRVKFQVRANVQYDYVNAAEYINVRQFDMVLLQHEYGIFGGKNGAHILLLIRSLRMPVVTTLHSVLVEPSDEQRKIIDDLAECSDYLIVLSEKARDILLEVYGVRSEQVIHIPHGIPDIPFRDPDTLKHQLGVKGRKVILTFGLMGPGKGIELMLESMPAVVEKNPDAVYLILGATHPQIKKGSGDKYRHQLQTMVSRLGIEDHVIFRSQFVTLDVLCEYLSAADVYCTPYPSREQIVSGTLAYAMGAGAAVVSTPYWYAEEMLADGRGRLVPFNDSQAFAREINALLAADDERANLRRRVHQHCRPMIWREVACRHIEVLSRAFQSRVTTWRPVPAEVHDASVPRLSQIVEELPEPNLSHLRTMTDDTGILQHAIYSTPNRRDGYCIDDNARALIAVSMHHTMSKDESTFPLVHIYLSFLHDAFNRDAGRFRNFMSYDRHWLEDVGSEDSHARALWGLGVTVKNAPNDAVRDMATQLFVVGLKAAESFDTARGCAFTLIGLHAYMEVYGGDATVRRLRGTLAKRLHDMFEHNATEDWPWCEDVATYANGKLPHALLLSGQWIPNPKMYGTGMRALRWLLEKQTAPEGHLTIFGSDSWFVRDGLRSSFDQQPIELLGLIEACAEAYRATGEREWLDHAQRCMRWFHGYNDIKTPIYDYRTGGCCDGLQPHGPNRNQGAESTLAWLISLMTMCVIVNEEIIARGKSPGA